MVNRFIIPALLEVAFCSLCGHSDEWHQSFVEGRFNWVADTSSAGLWYFCCIGCIGSNA
ncbi:MAG: VanZ family protein [Methylobacter tundripaludum]|nr:VanZ family protein [Methylobacter tundripaludum]